MSPCCFFMYTLGHRDKYTGNDVLCGSGVRSVEKVSLSPYMGHIPPRRWYYVCWLVTCSSVRGQSSFGWTMRELSLGLYLKLTCVARLHIIYWWAFSLCSLSHLVYVVYAPWLDRWVCTVCDCSFLISWTHFSLCVRLFVLRYSQWWRSAFVVLFPSTEHTARYIVNPKRLY